MNKTIVAWLRVRNEINFIERCLKSIQNVFDKYVITYNDCTDGTDSFLINYAKDKPNYFLYPYPYTVHNIGSKVYTEGNYKYENSLAALYEFALNKVQNNEYLFKIDGDTIYDNRKLTHIINFIKKDHYKKNKVYEYKMYNIHNPPDNNLYIHNTIKIKGKEGDHYCCQRSLIKGFIQKNGWEVINYNEPIERIQFNCMVGINLDDREYDLNNWQKVDDKILNFAKRIGAI